jgi:signal transduction histidine kinase
MILSYFKDKLIDYGIISLLIVIISFILRWYNLPWEGIFYCLIISFFFFFWNCIYRGIKFANKVKGLNFSQKEVFLTLERLPKPDNLIEEGYSQIISELKNQNIKLKSQMQTYQTEQNDYYTLWVHQIKTPIAAMRLLLQTEYTVKSLNQELFKIEQYVESVLYYLRLDSINSDFQFQSLPLGEIIEDILVKYAPSFIGKGLTLNLLPIDIMIVTDRKWLQFSLEQIISNAIKYTKQGSITISAKEQKLFIEDTGMGINPQDLPRIFERGFTGYNGRLEHRSTGIGLYLTKKILSKLGHDIICESVRGKGTLVILDFSPLNLNQ